MTDLQNILKVASGQLLHLRSVGRKLSNGALAEGWDLSISFTFALNTLRHGTNFGGETYLRSSSFSKSGLIAARIRRR